AVSVQTALEGKGDITLGNVVGSNLFNMLAIIGCSTLVIALGVRRQMITWDVPALIAISLAAYAMAWTGGEINRVEAVILLVAMVVYLTISFLLGKREAMRQDGGDLESPPEPIHGDDANTDASDDAILDPDGDGVPDFAGSESEGLVAVGNDPMDDDLKLPENRPWYYTLLDLLILIAGVVILVLGCNLFVFGSVKVAHLIGMSDVVIGLTIVSVGTSLPELVTSVMASLKGQREIAIGNAIGSSIMNLACVLGLAALVAPMPVAPQLLQFDMLLMVGVAVLCWPIFWTGMKIDRREGIFLLVLYVVYMAYVVFSSDAASAAK
ncbi:MAG: calcium/sodium antiporter, partial [Planctomycetota bacterium]